MELLGILLDITVVVYLDHGATLSLRIPPQLSRQRSLPRTSWPQQESRGAFP